MPLTKVPLSLLDAPGASGNVLTSDGTNWTSAAAAPGVPTGGIIYYPALSAPSGYLKCDGSIYNRSSYSALAAVIGTPALPSSETLRNSGLTNSYDSGYMSSLNGVTFLNGTGSTPTSAGANGLRTTTDGITFTSRTAANAYCYENTMAYFNSTYVSLITGGMGTINGGTTVYWQTSPDAATWTVRTMSVAANKSSAQWLAGNQTWGRGIMQTMTTYWDGCQYVLTTPVQWWYSTNATTWTAATGFPTNGTSNTEVCAGGAGALAFYWAGSGYRDTIYYTADGATWSNITSNIQSVAPTATRFQKVVWTGSYFYLYANNAIVLRSATGASGSWSVVTGTLGLGPSTSADPFTSLSLGNYRFLTDGTNYFFVYGAAIYYSTDMLNWGYQGNRTSLLGGVCGSTFVGRTTGTTFNTYTCTGAGYTVATQFPVPNLTLASTSAFGSAAPPPVAYIKT